MKDLTASERVLQTRLKLTYEQSGPLFVAQHNQIGLTAAIHQIQCYAKRMPNKIKICRLEPSSKLLEEMAVEAREQGYAFVDRLIDEARSGENTFDKKGECFFGAYIDETLVGCGGVNLDPYTDQEVGRLRHIYVLKRYRRTGVARKMVQHLLDQSKATFDVIRLRTSDQRADDFYEALGFSRTDEDSATHTIEF